jgi:hypothetical protein
MFALKFSTRADEFNANGSAFGSPWASLDLYVPQKVVLTCSRFAGRVWRLLCTSGSGAQPGKISEENKMAKTAKKTKKPLKKAKKIEATKPLIHITQ